jgi:hypothetical protein
MKLSEYDIDVLCHETLGCGDLVLRKVLGKEFFWYSRHFSYIPSAFSIFPGDCPNVLIEATGRVVKKDVKSKVVLSFRFANKFDPIGFELNSVIVTCPDLKIVVKFEYLRGDWVLKN